MAGSTSVSRSLVGLANPSTVQASRTGYWVQSSVSISFTLCTRRHAPVRKPAATLMNPGSKPVPRNVAPPCYGGGLELCPLLWMVCAGKEVARGHHVDAGAQYPVHQCVVDNVRGVDHAIGCCTDQGVDVVGGQDSYRRDPGQCACVAADLVWRKRMYPNEFEHIFTVEHGPKCALTNVARRPLHHAIPSMRVPSYRRFASVRG